ncbi:hypothetical protein FBZ89_103217 [Nitrospirillum amazonense]|uniref:Uncharacterized protein n=1 Tax=Nitrospirillum amazonense TaxID=28077 RepID=A0A560FLU6_9PROT|nr:hypothetical protein [Nitrospirillum amazonense]TWB22594.1 hypothetical protein FBZ89_103217 [Nitrospirillum amazonense]
MTPRKIAEKAWTYILYETGTGHVLSVLCGGVGIYELNIPLMAMEAARALADSAYLDGLAAEIRMRPQQFAGQSVTL